ncbi:uncharacterized protein LOC107366132 [Tetranychus urticae]|uniref:PUB domain-containing protein n=1 Tax=Tetranychus urticae TaxID=32264 RepID=T1KQD1_TETUR|nr:uncharacterized protein LOC107366132 [Tetranychus urticae]
MKNIKEFFSKKKLSYKFSNAPPGHKLGTKEEASAQRSSSSSASASKPQASSSSSRETPASSSASAERIKTAAAEAAERRQAQQLEKSKVKFPKSYLPPLEKEIEDERKAEPEPEPEEKINEDDAHKFNCPDLDIVEYSSLASLKEQIMEKIKSNFGEDPIICGSLLIRNCNPREKGNVCISTLEAILNNLRTEDEEAFAKFTKLRKIKIEPKILSANGGLEFLTGIGFNLSEDGEWFTFNDSKNGLDEKLLYYLDVLTTSAVFPIFVDREACVYDLNGLNTPNVNFDDKIFEMTKDELTREQQIRKEIADRESTLMTKAMRERFITRKPKSRYTRLRYKRLDFKMIEATFRTNETLYDFIRWLKDDHSMEDIENYDITCGTQTIPVEDWDKTFLDLDFYPKVTFYQRLRNAPME